MEFVKRSAIVSKKSFHSEHVYNEKYIKTKKSSKRKSTQTFTVINYEDKVLHVFDYC